jgi:hypothetical protein
MKKSINRSVPSISHSDESVIEPHEKKRVWSGWNSDQRIGTLAVCLFLVVGVFGAGLKYLEDSARQQKLNAKNSSNKENASLLNSVNPFLPDPTPTPTPQLSKEYIYAGSRMLAVEDKNASAVPPSDLAVWRPSTGYWYVLGGQSVQWGATLNNVADIPVPGDYDGDGKTDFSVFRASAGAWYIVRSSDSSNFSYSFGQTGDKEAPADFDGDGKTDAAIYRKDTPTNGNASWYIQRSSDSGLTSQSFGVNTDKPTPADFDGDGKADVAVWRSATAAAFYILRSSDQTYQTIAWGTTGDKPVVGDYDGDGKADAAVRNGNDWVIKQSSNSATVTVTWKLSTDKEVQNDYDGDGKTDIAVWREAESTQGAGDSGYWFIRQSSLIGQTNELRQVQWGSVGDTPVPAFYRR